MANTAADALIDTIRARAARSSDTVLITEAFVLRELNKAQVDIVKKCPRQKDMDKSDTSTYTLSTDDTSFDISTLNPAHIGNIWILNGADTNQTPLRYMPLGEFRKAYIPVSSEAAAEPVRYTRQGDSILLNCPVASDYNGLYLHIDYTSWATALTNADTSTSELADSDEGLILYTLARIFDEIAISQPKFEQKALKKRVLYEKWLEEYVDYYDTLFAESYDDGNY